MTAVRRDDPGKQAGEADLPDYGVSFVQNAMPSIFIAATFLALATLPTVWMLLLTPRPRA